MNRPEQTIKGITVRRRCDHCGTRIIILVDEGDRCLLKCNKCGKEYLFYIKRYES